MKINEKQLFILISMIENIANSNKYSYPSQKAKEQMKELLNEIYNQQSENVIDVKENNKND